jgi:hypothetical protein
MRAAKGLSNYLVRRAASGPPSACSVFRLYDIRETTIFQFDDTLRAADWREERG